MVDTTGDTGCKGRVCARIRTTKSRYRTNKTSKEGKFQNIRNCVGSLVIYSGYGFRQVPPASYWVLFFNHIFSTLEKLQKVTVSRYR
jgi:hypothetical protein